MKCTSLSFVAVELNVSIIVTTSRPAADILDRISLSQRTKEDDDLDLDLDEV